MLVSELAERADVPLATVKYYLREGLLPAGETTGPRRAEYDECHLRRLRVLRMLREVGGVSVTNLRLVADALDDETRSVHDVMTLVADVIAPGPTIEADPESLDVVDEVLGAMGWDGVRPQSMDRLRLAALVSLLNGPGPLGASIEVLTYYAGLADQLARAEVALVDHTVERSELLEQMVTGSVVYGQVFELLRQLGHEHHHQVRTGAPQPDGTVPTAHA
ncbi:MAG TPA: MerR family transcriptional regulator [Nocardioides sp.]|jgi:DNA-binding transcriptional MerR regulator|nr:MerR family transcriptional regulator [Nocardioides sp.]